MSMLEALLGQRLLLHRAASFDRVLHRRVHVLDVCTLCQKREVGLDEAEEVLGKLEGGHFQGAEKLTVGLPQRVRAQVRQQLLRAPQGQGSLPLRCAFCLRDGNQGHPKDGADTTTRLSGCCEAPDPRTRCSGRSSSSTGTFANRCSGEPGTKFCCRTLGRRGIPVLQTFPDYLLN